MTPTDTLLEVRKQFRQPPEKVFAALTRPEQVMQWFCPPGFECPKADIDLTPGGAYRFYVRKLPDGVPFSVTGVYRELDPPHSLRFSWRWLDRPEFPAGTEVHIELTPSGGGTGLLLRHTAFPEAKMRDDHNNGWNAVFAGLETYLNSQAHLNSQEG